MKTVGAFLVSILSVSLSLAQVDAAETERVIKRFNEPRHIRMIEGSNWALAHQFDDLDKMKAAFQMMDAYFEAFEKYEQGDKAPLETLGGVAGLKSKLSAMLKGTDSPLRCYAATMIGITGDKSMAPQLAKFLGRTAPKQMYCESERAIVALGLLGAVEHKPKIASYLRSIEPNERTAAVRSLALLSATEYAPRIVLILAERTNTHDTSPIQFLVDTGTAKSYKRELVAAMQDPIGTDRAKAAMYALASVGAKEHAKDIAAQLNDEFRKGDAALALALLGATEYEGNIAALLKAENSLVRCAALLALGILDAKKHVSAVVKLLNDPESFVQPYAAAALVLMRADAYYKDAMPHLENPNSLTGYLIGSKLSGAPEPMVESIKKRAIDAWKEARRATDK